MAKRSFYKTLFTEKVFAWVDPLGKIFWTVIIKVYYSLKSKKESIYIRKN